MFAGQGQAEMPAQGLNGLAVFGVGIAVPRPDDDDLKAFVIAAAGGQHGRGQAVAFTIPQGQKQRHLALQMRRQTDILFNKDRRCGFVGCRGLVFLAPEMLLDRMPHQGGFLIRLHLGLHTEPGFPARSIANVLHGNIRIRLKVRQSVP